MVEYPRWIYSTDGEAKVVMTEAQRNALAGDWYDTPTLRDMAVIKRSMPIIDVPDEVDEKTRLWNIAYDRNIKIDKRWNITKLKEVLGE